MAHDPRKPDPPAHTTGGRAIEQIQADLDDVKAQLREAAPGVESDAAKQRRQSERIAAAQQKWKLTHEPDDPFDPHQYDPPMVPLKIDPAKQRAFHALHYRIAKIEADLAAAMKATAAE